MKPTKSGFTLIELSIVLIIIGLVVGGIVAGKELIRNAEVRKTLSAMQGLELAVSTFKNKYGCIPGDCAKAVSFSLDTVDGTGDEKIDEKISGAPTYGQRGVYYGNERAHALYQIKQANLIAMKDFDPTTQPVADGHLDSLITPIGGGVFLNHNDEFGRHAMVLGAYRDSDEWVETYSVGNLLAAVDARTIDLKTDDGAPLTGNVYALFEGSGEDEAVLVDVATPDAAGCVSTATDNPYNLGETNKCAITIKAGF